MKFDELYFNVKNPIEDKDTINSLLEVYSKGGFEAVFYSNLVKTKEKEKKDEINKEDKELFYVNLFNEIKGNITGLTKEKYIELAKIGNTQGLLKIRKLLLQIPDVKTTSEITEIIDRVKSENLEREFRYYFSGMCKNDIWQHVSLRSTTGKLEPYDKVEHRLYLNAARQDIYMLASILKEKMKEHNLPFEFKFDITGVRDDSIIIFSSSEHLVENIEVLKEIELEYPDIISRMYKPLILTGIIDNWIGYGSEPLTDELNAENSYNTKRAKIVPNAIGSELKKWVSENKTTRFFNGIEEIEFEEFLADFCCQKLLEKMKRNYDVFDKKEEFEKYYGYGLEDIENPRKQSIIRGIIRRQLDKLIDAYTVDSLTEKVNINVKNQKKICFDALDFRAAMRELTPHIGRISPDFIQAVSNAIKASSSQYGIDPNNFSFDVYAKKSLEEAIEKKLSSTKTPPLLMPKTKQQNIQIVQDEQKPIEKQEEQITEEIFVIDEKPLEPVDLLNEEEKIKDNSIKEEVIEKQAEIAPSKDEVIEKQVEPPKEEIVENKIEIVPLKEDVIEKQAEIELPKEEVKTDNGEIEKEKEAEAVKQKIKAVFAKPNSKKSLVEKFQKVSNTKKNEELSNTNLQILIKHMKPSIENKQMILPNGTTMSAEEYISLLVFPQLPANGVIITSDGDMISVEDFIKNGVLVECQEKYFGNFPLYLHDKTKANMGVLKLKNDDKDYDMSINEIINYINPTLLSKPMQLPNNTVMPTPEYISKYYLQHVPYNGIIMLQNGNQISVKNYIEDILLYAVESKYNGNLPLAVYETTRRNNGVIDMNPEHFKKNTDLMKPKNNIIINKSAYR